MTVGIWNTNHYTQDIVKKSFGAMIIRLMPNGSAPLFALSSMLNSSTAVQVEHGFFTKTMIFPSLELAANIDASQTTLTVVSTSNLIPGQLHRFHETGEVVAIDQVISGTQVLVTRGIGGGADSIAFASDNPEAVQVGNAYEEASIRPQALAINPIRITNLTQIFRNTWAVSGSSKATQVIAGDTSVAENRTDCAAFHAAAIEQALFFGKKSQGTRNGQPYRTMDGLLAQVANLAYYPPSYSVPNIFPAGATTDFEQLEAMIDPTFDQTTDPKTGNERVVFVGGNARRVINNIGRYNGHYTLTAGETSFGQRFDTFHTTRGTIRVIEHPLFNTNNTWKSQAVVVDLSTFKLAYLGDRKTQPEEFNMDGKKVDYGVDAVGGSLLTELTCEVHNPPANAWITGLTAATRDAELKQVVVQP